MTKLPNLYFSSFICALILVSSISGQVRSDILIPFENEDGLFGYMNVDKEVVLEAQFEMAYPTYWGTSAVKKDGRYGMVNRKGEIVVPTEYIGINPDKALIQQFWDGREWIIFKEDGSKETQKYFEAGGCINTCKCKFFKPHQQVIVTGDKQRLFYKRPSVKSFDGFETDTLPLLCDSIYWYWHYLFLFQENQVTISLTTDFIKPSKFFGTAFGQNVDEIKSYKCDRCGSPSGKDIAYRIGELWQFLDHARFENYELKGKYYSVSKFFHHLALVEFEKGRYGYIDDKGNEYFSR